MTITINPSWFKNVLLVLFEESESNCSSAAKTKTKPKKNVGKILVLVSMCITWLKELTSLGTVKIEEEHQTLYFAKK